MENARSGAAIQVSSVSSACSAAACPTSSASAWRASSSGDSSKSTGANLRAGGGEDDLAELAAGRRRSARRPRPPRPSGTSRRRGTRTTRPSASRGRTWRSIGAGPRWPSPRAAGPQRRAVDPGPLAHQREQVELGLGPAAHADHRDAPADRQRVEVGGQVGPADQLEHDVERTVAARSPRSGTPVRRTPPPRRGGPRCARWPPPAPAATASCTPARPTPPAAPWTQSRSPMASPHCVNRASWAVVKTSGNPPAAGQSTPSGTGSMALVHHGQLGLAAAADDGHHAGRRRRTGGRRGPARPPRRPAPCRGCRAGHPGGAG